MSISVKNVLREVEGVALSFVAEHKRLVEDKDRLKKRVLELEQELENLSKDFGVKCKKVEILEKDRQKVLARIDKILRSLAGLDGRPQGRGE
jgi:chromosome segregation ATPase